MKRMTIKRRKPGLAKASVEPLVPHPDPPLARHVHSVTLHVGSRRYEMTLHSECREIPKSPAPVIEMPRRSGKKA